jgi:hypothetical protein
MASTSNAKHGTSTDGRAYEYAATFADSSTPVRFEPTERAELLQWIADRAHRMPGQDGADGFYAADRNRYARSIVDQAERQGYAVAFAWDVPALVEAWTRDEPHTDWDANADAVAAVADQVSARDEAVQCTVCGGTGTVPGSGVNADGRALCTGCLGAGIVAAPVAALSAQQPAAGTDAPGTPADAATERTAPMDTYAGTAFTVPAGRHPFALADWLADRGVIEGCSTDSDAADAILSGLAAAAFDYGLSLGAAAFEDGTLSDSPLSGQWADDPTIGRVFAEAARTVAEDTAGSTGADARTLTNALHRFGVKLDAEADQDDTVADAFEAGYAWTADQYPDTVCAACALAAANGEETPDADRPPLALAESHGLTVTVGGTPSFRAAPYGGCPGCGSGLAGDFWPASLTSTDGAL